MKNIEDFPLSSFVRTSDEARALARAGQQLSPPMEFYDNFVSKVQRAPSWSPDSERVSHVTRVRERSPRLDG